MTIEQLAEVLTIQARLWETYYLAGENAVNRFAGKTPKSDAWQAGYAAAYGKCAESIRFILKGNDLAVF